MTVKELKEFLGRYPNDMQVVIPVQTYHHDFLPLTPNAFITHSVEKVDEGWIFPEGYNHSYMENVLCIR